MACLLGLSSSRLATFSFLTTWLVCQTSWTVLAILKSATCDGWECELCSILWVDSCLTCVMSLLILWPGIVFSVSIVLVMRSCQVLSVTCLKLALFTKCIDIRHRLTSMLADCGLRLLTQYGFSYFRNCCSWFINVLHEKKIPKVEEIVA